jgi:hypothetical protein
MAEAPRSHIGIFGKAIQTSQGLSLRPDPIPAFYQDSNLYRIFRQSGSIPGLRTISQSGWQSLTLTRSHGSHLYPCKIREVFNCLHLMQDPRISVNQIFQKQHEKIRKVQENNKLLSYHGKDILDLARNWT